MNVGNVPINKVKRIISGLTMNEINLSEGFISKLQKRAASKLNSFRQQLYDHIIAKLKIVYWDDTVIMVNKKQACLRFYGDDSVALYYAHGEKNKAGIRTRQP